MINLRNLPGLKKQHLTSVLGLALDGSRLDGAVLRRTNGSLQVEKTFSASLSLDPLTAAPELVGREIRNHLDAAGIRERFCVVGLPLKWALITHVEVPQLPEEDVASFLQIEAEKSFHSDVATLHYAVSLSKLSSGKQQALLAGISRTHLQTMELALQAARLKPVSFTFALTALQPPAPDAGNGTLALAIGETTINLEITSGGGVAALRTIEGATHSEASERLLDPDLIAREARITLGQLSAELREAVRTLRVFGPRDLAQKLADQIELRFENLGLKAEVASRYHTDDFGLHLPPETAVSAAISLAATHLAGRKPSFELLPPRVSRWQQAAARYSSGKLSTVGTAAGVVLLLIILGFGFQQWQLSRLRSKWYSMASKVRELDALEQEIRQYRPWYDESFRALSIMRQLTSAFPEDGVVSARTVEIRDLNAVTCTGTTRDQQALLKTLERLRGSKNITDVRIGTIRGNKPPLQFTFDFHWNEGGKN
jgi:hypothetical protein